MQDKKQMQLDGSEAEAARVNTAATAAFEPTEPATTTRRHARRARATSCS